MRLRSPFAGRVRVVRLVGGVLSAQTVAQLLTLASGFLLLRWMSIESYAQYTIAFGFLATLSGLLDLGFMAAVMPLVGTRANDANLIGGYLRAALHLRGRMAMVVVPVSAVVFFVLTAGHRWGVVEQLGLFATVLLGLFARAMIDTFSLPLLMHNAYRSFYSAQVSTSIGRIAAHALLQLTRGLTGFTASLVNALVVLVNGLLYRRSAAAHSDLPARVDPVRAREIRRMAAPAVPGLIFYAFQGQITILLVAVFGRTEAIAQVGALSRVGALFVVFASLNQVLIAPRFPRIEVSMLSRRIAQTAAAAAALGAVLTAVAFLVPQPLLFLLGPAYDGLRTEVAWFVLGAGLAFLAGVLYTMNLARRFVWWWSTALGLGMIVLTQLASAVTLDLASPLELQYFAALTGVAACVAQVVPLIHGLRHGPRIV